MIPHAWQQAAIASFDALGGVACFQPPGAGKSLVGAECMKRGARPLYVTKASARAQTRRMLKSYGYTGPDDSVISYNAISLDDGLLERLRPDVLVVDESQALKNLRSAAWTRRVARYLAQHPECRVAALSGSVMGRSALDYLHFLVWTLRAGAPCPRSSAAWPRFVLDIERDPAAWLERLRSCPGVFLDAAPSWNGHLLITEDWREPLCPDALARAEAGTAPDGWAVEGWAQDELEKQLACGFYLRREPRPSPALLDAQRSWNKCVEQAKAYGLSDTELGARAVYPTGWAQWQRALAAEPEAEQVVEWLSRPYVPHHAQDGTIIWVHHGALGESLAWLMGVPYQREGGLSEDGVRLDETHEPVVIASIAACNESFNAQQFRHNIVLEPPSDARVWQQLLCRTARQGQLAREVTCEVVIQAPIFGRALDSARKAAHKIESESGQQQWLIQAEKQR
jgi:hypothetical protein